MSAYILLDDIPESCESCPIRDAYLHCPVIKGSYEMTLEEQKYNCPIKTFPKERKRGYKSGYKTGYNDGWNDCLDALEEGEEIKMKNMEQEESI